MPVWLWDVLAAQWDEGYAYLNTFVAREGHARVPARFKTIENFALGQWVSTQRGQRKKLTPERKARLDAFPGWMWRLGKK